MKELIKKELRENLWLAGLALLLLSLLLGSNYIEFRSDMTNFARGFSEAPNTITPLDGPSFEYAMFLCGIFGAVLGWLQVFRERQRKVWAFLLHRPMTPTAIFLAKAAAGVGLYTVAMGVPLLIYVLWASRPGNVPSPFNWWMVAPVAVAFLHGLMYYAAGMYGASRRVRWFGSRILAFGLPVLIFSAGLAASSFMLAMALWLVALATLVTAAWASFCNSGYPEGEHWTGKPAGAVALAGGWTLVVFLLVVMFADLLERAESPKSRFYYTVTRDGTVYKVHYGDDAPAPVTDLQGKPARDSTTGQPLTVTHLNADAATVTVLQMRTPPPRDENRRWLTRGREGFDYWGASHRTIWYLVEGTGRLVAYDVVSGGIAGSIGPSGFAPDAMGDGSRFEFAAAPVLGTAEALYEVDLWRRTATKFFSTSPDEPIEACGPVSMRGQRAQEVLVLTRGSLMLANVDEAMLWRADVPPAIHALHGLRVHMLEQPGAVLVWQDPPPQMERSKQQRTEAQLTWIRDGRIAETAAVPTRPHNEFGSQERLLAVAMPPVFVALTPVLLGMEWNHGWSQLVIISIVAALICAAIGGFLARIRGASTLTCAGWAVGILFLNLPGLLALLMLEERPVCESPSGKDEEDAIFEEGIVPVPDAGSPAR